MKKFWPDFSYELYERACRSLDYPQVPFGPALKRMISKEDMVVDLGCGMGFPAMHVASMCRKVIGVDQDQEALAYLARESQRLGIRNLQTVCGIWPDVQLPECDVLMAFYVSGFAEDRQGLERLLGMVRKGGLIATQGPEEGDSFHGRMAQELGVEPRKQRCGNGCLIRGKLEMQGCRVGCEKFLHEFGQPVSSLEEAVNFFMWQLRLSEEYRGSVEDMAERYMEKREEGWYIPIKRSCCAIEFWKN